MTSRGCWAGLTLSVFFLLTGCKGFWDAPTGGGSGTNPLSGNIYVLNAQTQQIAGYAVNSGGSLVALPGSPYAVPAAFLPTPAMTISPNNSFLYISTANGIYLYNIATNGSLTLGNSSGPISNDQAVSMQVDSTNSWLVNVSAAAPYVYAIAISPTAGTITSKTEQFIQLPVATVRQVVISPDNSFLFVAMGTGGTAAIPFTATNPNPIGTITTIPVVNTGGAAQSVAVDPLGLLGQTVPRLFYIGETAAVSGSNSGGLRVFDFSTFKELTGSPMGTQGLAPFWILPTSSGSYVYVANRQTSAGSTGVIAGYSIASSGSTYTLTQLGATFSAGTSTQALVEDNTGAYIFAANAGGSPDLTGYTFSTTNVGYLVSSISSATGTDPVLASAIAAAH